MSNTVHTERRRPVYYEKDQQLARIACDVEGRGNAAYYDHIRAKLEELSNTFTRDQFTNDEISKLVQRKHAIRHRIDQLQYGPT